MARNDPGGRVAAAIRAAVAIVAARVAGTEAGRPVAAADQVARVVAHGGNRPAGPTDPDRHAGAPARGRHPVRAQGPGAVTAAGGPTATGERIVRPTGDRRIGRVPTPDAASGSVARPARRVARQVGRRAAMVRGHGTVRETATDRARRTPTVHGAGSDPTTGADRVRAPTIGIGHRAPGCRPALAIGTAMVTKVGRPGDPTTRADRAGWTGRPCADRRARRSGPGLPASRGVIAAAARARVRIDDPGTRGPRPTATRDPRSPKWTSSTTTRS